MLQETKDKIKLSAANAHKMASNWVAVVWGGALAILFAMPADALAAVVSRLPVPAWTVPVIVAVIGVVARLWPQKSITPEVTAAKSESDSEST